MRDRPSCLPYVAGQLPSSNRYPSRSNYVHSPRTDAACARVCVFVSFLVLFQLPPPSSRSSLLLWRYVLKVRICNSHAVAYLAPKPFSILISVWALIFGIVKILGVCVGVLEFDFFLLGIGLR